MFVCAYYVWTGPCRPKIRGGCRSGREWSPTATRPPDYSSQLPSLTCSHFAKTPKSALWSQLISIPFGFAITSFIGIIASSSSTVIFGTTIWNPPELLSQFLVGASSGERFGIFIIASGFTLAQLGTNIAANSVSAGTDMTALLPRFLNIRRGGYICKYP
ncbi:permease for cytosine/purines, uracil, thiamine, allantoin-domain-containing protein [Talaromyces proteolyticus]|uniref:Permease for cytosine/purines, uracil, thiamine, allantoin-domain-containing protein n=1 Tax=Talaromyces proteolyticus TaxID=1131652 RepID=A0AAD4PUU9_9EURO|nr:permease for cytosine/purines, uracil, thiamine, allantoin-domain-containing protein [Talaromyces proteolyticus]KAH8695531.1 permease for cytosine/purines, uracil, thiamine, allantoin-domain-containing protein [Talaromyces proteolyticus]